ncbi:hypothetical protein [Haladaptatus halobius]|uniref:hypothetical protein n=1 Tax=Haladaptatus halobius TaxID=2884875 RepID=UPI001D0BC52F|nr:hypothetical protein [Haladaptatus halobius]
MPGSRIGVDRRVVTGILLLVLFGLIVVQPGFLAPHSVDETERKEPEDVRLVKPKENSSAKLWPFTSRRKSFDSLTLPINAVIRGHSERVVTQLKTGRGAKWDNQSNEWRGVGDEDEPVVVNDQIVEWRNTTGATRYTYIQAPGSRGGWVTETAQLHDGTYFGSRYHLRLYEAGKGNQTWTAVQAHHEHWDWFRLRHSVGSLSMAQYYLDSQYYGKWYVDDISRERFANGGISDTDGWVSVIELRETSELRPVSLVWVALFLGSVGVQESVLSSLREAESWLSTETNQRGVALTATLIGLPLLVRSASIFVETTVPAVPVKAIAGIGYLVYVVGLPLATVGFPKGGRSLDWFGVAVVALGLGFLLDYRSIGVKVLPIAVVLHRLVVLAVVGTFAVGGAQQKENGRWNVVVKAALAIWVAVLAWPLFYGF